MIAATFLERNALVDDFDDIHTAKHFVDEMLWNLPRHELTIP